MAQEITSHYDFNLVRNCKEIPQHIAILITTILRMVFEIDKQNKSILESVSKGEYTHLPKQSAVCEYLKWNPILNDLRKELYETADASILLKIVELQTFTREGSFGISNEFLIPMSVLPKMGSFDTVNRNSDKAEVARKLGAKLI